MTGRKDGIVRLKTNIFLWVLLASIFPLAILTLAAITYSEKQYLKEVNREFNASLNNIVSEIDRRLYYERQMILSLANSASMRQFLRRSSVSSTMEGDTASLMSLRASSVDQTKGVLPCRSKSSRSMNS